MTDEQINAAIAEVISPRLVLGKCKFYKSGEGWVVDCPNYCNDLNRMHEAEQHIFKTRKDNSYGHQLATSECQTMWHVTARQRAEAFLRTLGKWEGGE